MNHDARGYRHGIRIYRIYDIEGYRWEIAWTDSPGEEWNEEAATDEDLFERIGEIVAEWDQP